MVTFIGRVFSFNSDVWQQQTDLQLDCHQGIGHWSNGLMVTPHSGWYPEMPPSHFLSLSCLHKRMQPLTHSNNHKGQSCI